jgi:hypothetical protein
MSENRMNPFPGLRPFESGESDLFFGREAEVDDLLERLSRAHVVTVTGTSGSGKSSLLRAGLLPALLSGLSPMTGEAWRVAIMRPGYDPLGNLAHALNSAGWSAPRGLRDEATQLAQTEVILNRSNLGLISYVNQFIAPAENVLVVVDQFEELFRFAVRSEESDYVSQAAAFVKLLLEAGHSREVSVYIVISMRSDFLGDADQFQDLPETINAGQYLIPRMTRDQYREAITGPLLNRASISQPLVNRLLNDIGNNPGQLPVFQFALMQTWEYWAEHHESSNPIDIDDYEAIGGMAMALSLAADEAFNELHPGQQKIAEKLFKSLTEKGPDNRELRRPGKLSELCELTESSQEELISVIDVFRRERRSFLMPPAFVQLNDQTIIDISHESLIRNWQRLSDWVEGEAQSIQVYSRLSDTAQRYQKGEAALLLEPELQFALKWREVNRPNEAWSRRLDSSFHSVMNFLEESLRAREHEMMERERQRMRELRRTRAFALTLSLAFVFALVLGVYAFRQRNIAIAQRETAEVQSKLALKAQQEAERQRLIAETAKNELANMAAKKEAQLQREIKRKRSGH